MERGLTAFLLLFYIMYIYTKRAVLCYIVDINVIFFIIYRKKYN